MELAHVLLGTIVLLGVVGFIGFFKTKEQGFGPYNTSILLIMTVTFLSALLLVGGHIEGALFGHIIFGVLGFSGGLFVAK